MAVKKKRKNSVLQAGSRKSDLLGASHLKEFPLSRFLPNIATLMALCTGLTAIHFTMMGRYEAAVLAVLVAGILDVLDGRLARMLGAESDFGAEMDSLSDFVCFGVVPGLMLYMWTLKDWKGWGWAICLFYVVCTVWRLARFNTQIKNPDKKVFKGYFIGMPAPMGAYVALLPMMAGFAFDKFDPVFNGVYFTSLLISGLLMISVFPTISTKSYTFKRKAIVPTFLLLAIITVALLTAPWEVLSLFGLGYLASIPFTYFKFRSKIGKANLDIKNADVTGLTKSSKNVSKIKK